MKTDPNQTPRLENLSTIASRIPYALRLLAIILLAIFLVESMDFLHLPFFGYRDTQTEVLLHILSSTILVFPLLYVIAYRPLLALLSRAAEAEAQLKKEQAAIEQRILERTAELQAANFLLQQEIKLRQQVTENLQLQMAAVQSAANGILVTDNQGQIEWSNPAFTRMTGYAQSELQGQNINLLNSGQNPPGLFQQLWTTIQAGQVWQGELINRRKDGSLYIEEQTITPVMNSQGVIKNYVAIKQDITRRKQAETQLAENFAALQKLSEAERRQRRLAESLVQATLALNSSLEVETVLDIILEQIQQVIPCSSTVVVLLKDEQVISSHHRGRALDTLALPEFAVGATLEGLPRLAQAINKGGPFLVDQEDLAQQQKTRPALDWIHSLAVAPLQSDELIFGGIYLASEETGFFTPADIRDLQAFTAHAVLAVQNSRLLSETRLARERLLALSHRLVDIQETERRKIARELHDEAGQALTSLKVSICMLDQKADDLTAIRADLQEMNRTTDAVMDLLHNLAVDLRPASLDHLGLVVALQQYLERMEKTHHLDIAFENVGVTERLPAETETALYRILQEALTNVARHARATQVGVLLEKRDGKIIVIVEDNGSGFDPTRPPDHDHLGLVGMQERVDMLGGSMEIESQAGKGTTVFIEVPDGH